MDFIQWSQLALICVMGAISPGPSLAVVLRNTISGNRTQGVLTGIGHGLGITFYSVVALTGLVSLLKSIPNFFLIAQIIGSFYLIWLGSKMLISGIGDTQTIQTEKHTNISESRGFSVGFMIAFLNPKIAVWLLAIFSQFVKPEAAFQDQLLLVSTVGGIDTSWYCLVAFLASSKRLLKTLQSNAKRIDLMMGTLLILLATGMLWRAITHIS
ncbi:MAG: LysE family translocator [SAR324 cluster bacterium]|nr:LysE family translocator [SAR324 cluster bacterium]MBL7035330.1 LysE family translocator [SAR324 cluster bacterium]